MEENINLFIRDNPSISGTIILLISLILLIYNLKRKDGFNFEDFGILNWQAFFSLWVLTIVLFIIGLKLIF